MLSLAFRKQAPRTIQASDAIPQIVQNTYVITPIAWCYSYSLSVVQVPTSSFFGFTIRPRPGSYTTVRDVTALSLNRAVLQQRIVCMSSCIGQTCCLRTLPAGSSEGAGRHVFKPQPPSSAAAKSLWCAHRVRVRRLESSFRQSRFRKQRELSPLSSSKTSVGLPDRRPRLVPSMHARCFGLPT